MDQPLTIVICTKLALRLSREMLQLFGIDYAFVTHIIVAESGY